MRVYVLIAATFAVTAGGCDTSTLSTYVDLPTFLADFARQALAAFLL